MKSLTMTVLTTEIKEYNVTIVGVTDDDSREIIRDMIESASDIHDAVRCIVNECGNDIELDAGRQVGYELEVIDAHKSP